MSLVGNYNLDYFEIRKARFTDFCEYVSRLNDYHERKDQEEKMKNHAGDSWF